MARFAPGEAGCAYHQPTTTEPTTCVAHHEAAHNGELFMLKALVPAAIVSILAATFASAAPGASPLVQLKTVMPAETLQIQDHERHGVHGRGYDHRYTPGRRYDRAPGHYRRHAHRPHDWRTRGCIQVGAAWFCV
jgi:Ni/Co efflux regulator RcnB